MLTPDECLALLNRPKNERWSVEWTEGENLVWQYFVQPAPEAERQAREFASTMPGAIVRKH